MGNNQSQQKNIDHQEPTESISIHAPIEPPPAIFDEEDIPPKIFSCTIQ